MRALALLLAAPAAAVFEDGEWGVRHHPPTWHAERRHMVNTTTYTSPLINLKTGEADFTIAGNTNLPFPDGDYAIVRADFQMIRGDSQEEVPLSEVYNHHWLIPGLSYCEGDLYFGAGAEMRGQPAVIPNGYGMHRKGASGKCGANLHFIRTDDLATEWSGLNDPSQFPDPPGAAVKNCVECGWAPKRALECPKAADGTFACCFTGSRCPVNNPSNKTTRSYRLQYEVQYTRDMAATKPMLTGMFDVSGQVEWNIAPNADTPAAHTKCDDKVCVTVNSMTVDENKGFGNGICPGVMLQSHLHQHMGAINGTMLVNGKEICASYPKIGTDKNNAVGNELGYVTGFNRCIDADNLGNAVRLAKGDVLTVKAFYDVDPASTAYLPHPGGKHGGVMALFFYYMDCSKDATYHCVDGQCVEKADGVDLPTCQAAC